MKPNLVYTALLFTLVLPFAAAQSPALDPSREDIKRLIVRIDSTFQDKAGFGAGIVLGMQNDQIYIVTANHVVREGETSAKQIKVQFRGHKEQLVAQPGTHYDTGEDLAVVIVSNAKANGIDAGAFPFDRLGDSSALAQGDPVFLAGHPQGVPWSVTVTPDAFIEPDEDSLRFESKSLFPGHSGGALLNFRLEIIGLLRSDQQPNGDALNIVKALAMLKNWGYPVQLSQRFTATNLETLSLGAAHSCYVGPHGTASCWGLNDLGQLGLGTSTDTPQPSPVHGHKVFVSISAGYKHTCAITTSAEALCWGSNDNGQLGTIPTAPDGYPRDELHMSVPTPVLGGLLFRDISAGNEDTCGLTTKGQAYCWGANFNGELGAGPRKLSFVPTAVAGGHTFRSIRAGSFFTCGIDDTGSLFCWGKNRSGQLGDGSMEDKTSPSAVAGGLKWASIATGDFHACGIATNGKAYCWGDNKDGELGISSAKLSAVPVAVEGRLNFIAIYASGRVTYALTKKGRAYCWGWDLGKVGVCPGQVTINVPVPIFGEKDETVFKSLWLAPTHACGLTVAGEIHCWGDNAHGQLGNGSKETTYGTTLISPQP
jgi:alpha-tubulin suppressor-like RCC1 family protein